MIAYDRLGVNDYLLTWYVMFSNHQNYRQSAQTKSKVPDMLLSGLCCVPFYTASQQCVDINPRSSTCSLISQLSALLLPLPLSLQLKMVQSTSPHPSPWPEMVQSGFACAGWMVVCLVGGVWRERQAALAERACVWVWVCVWDCRLTQRRQSCTVRTPTRGLATPWCTTTTARPWVPFTMYRKLCSH